MAVNATRTDEQVQTVSKRKTLARMFYYLLAYKKQVVAVLTIMLVSVVITLINPLIIQQAIDVYIVAVLLNLTLVLLVKIRMYIMAKVSNEVLLTIREELYTHIQTLSFQFFDSRPTGKILARIIGDVNSLKEVLSNSVTTLIPDFITILSVVGIMFVKNWKLAAAALSSLPLMILGVAFVQSKSHIRWQIHRKKGSNMNAFVHEDISGMYVVQSFGAEQETKQIFEELLQEHKDSFVDAVRYADAFGPIVDFCWGLGTMVLYFFGVNMILDGMLQVGTLIAFGTYISMFWRPVMNLSNFYNQLVTNIAGAERIFEILDTKPDLTDGETACEMPEITGAVSFRPVTFFYEKEKEVLKDVSFEVRDGEFIGLIGHTGSGKSTLIQHLNGLIRPTSGDILFHGTSIYSEGYSMKELRSKVGLVFQYPEHQLFEAAEEGEKRARHALKLVGLDEKFYKRSPFELSGGQKRRVAIAGVLAMRPEVMILDEPTAGLDPRGRDEILEQIERLNRQHGLTIILVSHSMGDVARYVDQLMVMDHGRKVFDGTPKEVFRHWKELESMGLAAPQVTYLVQELRAEGVGISDTITTVEEARDALLSFLGRQERV